uniref:Uncharacterized protein n=1 Tax=Anopheles minimus TaxID=112268 RepID=A0A182VYP6_9DIPT
MTIGSVKHSNVLPQPAAASSARVTSAYDYNGTGSSGVGGGISGSGSLTHGVGGGGNIRSSGIAGGRITPRSPSSTDFRGMRSTAKRCLFDSRPDPIDTKRICDENDKAERQRALKRYEFDTHTCRSMATSGSSSSSGGLHHRHHHQ